MFIDPRQAIDNGWISGIKNLEKQLQPNAIDFTLDKVFTVASNNDFIISEDGKQMRGGSSFEAVKDRRSEKMFWTLYENSLWDCLSDVYVDVPNGVACMLIARSSFIRNGLFLTSGLYDSGFKGHIGFVLHNRAGFAKVGVGTRIGQVIFVESQNAKTYSGGYNHEVGTLAHQEKPTPPENETVKEWETE